MNFPIVLYIKANKPIIKQPIKYWEGVGGQERRLRTDSPGSKTTSNSTSKLLKEPFNRTIDVFPYF